MSVDPDRWDDALTRLLAVCQSPSELTPAERRVLIGYSVGLKDRTVGLLNGTSANTVKRQSMLARRRLGARNTTHAVALAIRRGLIP